MNTDTEEVEEGKYGNDPVMQALRWGRLRDILCEKPSLVSEKKIDEATHSDVLIVIDAYCEQLRTKGYVIVKREPTEEMLEAGKKASCLGRMNLLEAWVPMIKEGELKSDYEKYYEYDERLEYIFPPFFPVAPDSGSNSYQSARITLRSWSR
ncbi:hypothetical protein IID62_05600 [candidate division KSB1 bacterium]|nr:hypothetical protein [candidate division KSB1 bacterium]